MESMGLLQALCRDTPDAVLVVDDRQVICLANPQAEAIFGWPPTELAGQPLDVVIPVASREGHATLARSYQHAPVAREMGAGLRLYAARRDGSEFPVDVALGPVALQGARYVACIVRPLAEAQVASSSGASRHGTWTHESRDVNVTALQSMFGVGLSLSASLDNFGTEASRARVEQAAADLRRAVEQIRASLQDDARAP